MSVRYKLTGLFAISETWRELGSEGGKCKCRGLHQPMGGVMNQVLLNTRGTVLALGKPEAVGKMGRRLLKQRLDTNRDSSKET